MCAELLVDQAIARSRRTARRKWTDTRMLPEEILFPQSRVIGKNDPKLLTSTHYWQDTRLKCTTIGGT